jgi:hypothetical protein
MMVKEFIISFDDEIEITYEQDSIIRDAIHDAMSKAGLDDYCILLA